MVPCDFEESNLVLDKPEGMTHDECEPLCIAVSTIKNTEQPILVSCWKFTKEEIEEINKTGRLYLIVFGTTHPVVALQGINPFRV